MAVVRLRVESCDICRCSAGNGELRNNQVKEIFPRIYANITYRTEYMRIHYNPSGYAGYAGYAGYGTQKIAAIFYIFCVP